VDFSSFPPLSISQYDLDSGDAGRNELGVLQRDPVRQGIYKIEVERKGVTSAQLSKILAAIKPPSFPVKFLTADGFQTKTMYTGDRSIELVRNWNGDRWNISFNLIEY
jgi:hypothetical protein